MITLGSSGDTVVTGFGSFLLLSRIGFPFSSRCLISQTLYSPPEFGVSSKGMSCTGVDELFELLSPLACAQDTAVYRPVTTPPATTSWRHSALSLESRTAPDGSVTWK